MNRKTAPIYIQPDARGRIQLPKQLRGFPLFKLGENAEGYQLTPLKVVEDPPAKTSSVLWLTAEVDVFLSETLLPKLKKHLDGTTPPHLEAAFLYGSRARGDALSRSDFDFGLLVGRYPTNDQRNSFTDELQALLKPEFEILRSHGVDAEASFHFFASRLNADSIPPVYFSVVTDGRLVWQESSKWDAFKKSVQRYMKAKRVHSTGEGKKRIWKWETK